MVKIKGANPADKQNVAMARAVNKVKPVTRTTRNEETAEAKTALVEKKAAAQSQFDRADMAASETLEETQARMAARGF